MASKTYKQPFDKAQFEEFAQEWFSMNPPAPHLAHGMTVEYDDGSREFVSGRKFHAMLNDIDNLEETYGVVGISFAIDLDDLWDQVQDVSEDLLRGIPE